MNKIEIQLEDSLNRVNFFFKNEEITTEGISDHDGFSILGESFGPFEKGKKYRIPYFVALPFIENNILKIDSKEKCDNTDVQRYAISERDDQRLLYRENKLFLNKIKEFRFLVEKEVIENKIPKLDLDRFSSYTINIVDNRLLKLLKLARASLSLDDERKLTSSEKLLFAKLFDLIKVWRNFFLTKK
ncbi:MAG: hypothetical protein KGD61_03370 [Candidatus Lokiarchaeota archaeon]|nr:hypothetical protein [Candidatus Lokiarchaeota archaeon]